MGLISWLVDKEARFAWSLVGAIVGLLSLALGYLAVIEKKADVALSVIGEANVFDIH